MNPTRRYIGDDAEDKISLLPDSILVDILSLLSVEEAARTSVLSSRWINLWEHTNCLNLDRDTSSSASDGSLRIYEILRSEGPKYVRWVNRILQSHKALTLKEFRIKFPFILDKNATESIARWLEFAFARHVQRLVLDFSSPCEMGYCFPEELLAPLSMLLDFRCLRVLSFTAVNVADRVIDFFLHNCPLLEQLLVHLSRKLSNVEVCGSSLALKHLEIAHCLGLESLKVSAPSLTHLKVLGAYGIPLLVGNVPMLVETHMDCDLEDIQRLFSTLYSHVSQLEILHLMVFGYEGTGKGATSNLPQLPKLNKLWILHEVAEPKCFVRLVVDLIRASPRLEEFVLENGCFDDFPPWNNEVVEDVIKSPHQHLKVVKYIGYCGFAADLQFVSYILENCIALETLMIELSVFQVVKSKSRRRHSSPKEKYEKTGGNNVKRQLEALVPRHVALVFL